MNRKKIIVLVTTLIISTLAFVGCGKTNNDNSLNKEKAKVEDTNKNDTKEEDTKEENTKEEDNNEDAKSEDSEVEKADESETVGESDTELSTGDSSESNEVKLKEYDAVATIDSLMFGANVTVTCEDSEVATYKIFTEIDGKMEALHNDKVTIGEAAKELFPAVEGQQVVVKFFDADGVLLGESKTTLVV